MFLFSLEAGACFQLVLSVFPHGMLPVLLRLIGGLLKATAGILNLEPKIVNLHFSGRFSELIHPHDLTSYIPVSSMFCTKYSFAQKTLAMALLTF